MSSMSAASAASVAQAAVQAVPDSIARGGSGQRRASLYAFDGRAPRIAAGAFVAAGAVVVGDVQVGEGGSVWFGAVLRGDNGAIRIGPRSNVQDGAVIHCLPAGRVELGCGVSVGHQAAIHGASIGDHCLIGLQAIVLDGACIGSDTLVAAGSLVPPGRRFGPGVLVKGRPARAVRCLTAAERDHIRSNADEYVERAGRFARGLQAL